jgi:hypothetical protein
MLGVIVGGVVACVGERDAPLGAGVGLATALDEPEGIARAEPPTDRLVVVGAGPDVDVQPAMSAAVSASTAAAPLSPKRPGVRRTFPLITGRL